MLIGILLILVVGYVILKVASMLITGWLLEGNIISIDELPKLEKYFIVNEKDYGVKKKWK